MSQTKDSPADYIVPLDMNGLSGRMLHMPAPDGKKTEFLFVYGQHSSLERWWGLIQFISSYGAVTAPDLPGLGGMDSFYAIGKKPTIDNFADYLAAFMKMRYKNKQVVIVGMSLGFAIATRMLQRYPELKKNVSMFISLVGIVHGDDFSFPRGQYLFFRSLVSVMSHRLPALFFRYGCLNSFVLRAAYHRTPNAKHKFAAARNAEEHRRFMDVEIWLWQHNDVRTHAMTTIEMMKLDNCKQQLDIPVWHVTTDVDQYLDSHRVEQHLRIAFSEVHLLRSKLPHHAPSIIADVETAAPLIPEELRHHLKKLP
jgi:pimeloyl-ACP methyl ester carboxylesterase